MPAEHDPHTAAEAQTRDVRRLSATLPRAHDITSLPSGASPGRSAPGPDGARLRLVVATDWSSLSVPLAVLSSYADAIPSNAPVDLVFAVPHLPAQRDEDNVRALLRAIDERSQPAGVRVESFEESAGHPCFHALVPYGDVERLVMDLASLLMAMHAIARWATDASRTLPETFLERPVSLRSRLDRYAEPDAF